MSKYERLIQIKKLSEMNKIGVSFNALLEMSESQLSLFERNLKRLNEVNFGELMGRGGYAAGRGIAKTAAGIGNVARTINPIPSSWFGSNADANAMTFNKLIKKEYLPGTEPLDRFQSKRDLAQMSKDDYLNKIAARDSLMAKVQNGTIDAKELEILNTQFNPAAMNSLRDSLPPAGPSGLADLVHRRVVNPVTGFLDKNMGDLPVRRTLAQAAIGGTAGYYGNKWMQAAQVDPDQKQQDDLDAKIQALRAKLDNNETDF